ncbi:MAG: DUF3793 family protein [Clostridia bacterium]|nr:DUF3793 family protein [Clostridia bacterium]
MRSSGSKISGAFLTDSANLQNIRDDQDYLRAMIIYWAAPVIAEAKPSVLVSLTQSRRGFYHLWEKYKKDLMPKLHLEYIELRTSAAGVLVLFFDSVLLRRALGKEANQEFLAGCGYPEGGSLDAYLEILKERFAAFCPHEVGVFLGIPVEDVTGFIKNEGKGYLLNDYWKVYHNPRKAKKTFALFDKARSDAVSFLQYGFNH